MSDEFVKAADIGALFNKGPRWFERHRKELMQEGFPKPISRGSWLRQQVIDFREQRGRTDKGVPSVTITVPPVVDVKRAIERTLHHRR